MDMVAFLFLERCRRASDASGQRVLRMVKRITISEIARIPLVDGIRRAYQYVDSVEDAAALAVTIDENSNHSVR
jgi:hypothetical protein